MEKWRWWFRLLYTIWRFLMVQMERSCLVLLNSIFLVFSGWTLLYTTTWAIAPNSQTLSVPDASCLFCPSEDVLSATRWIRPGQKNRMFSFQNWCFWESIYLLIQIWSLMRLMIRGYRVASIPSIHSPCKCPNVWHWQGWQPWNCTCHLQWGGPFFPVCLCHYSMCSIVLMILLNAYFSQWWTVIESDKSSTFNKA